MNLYGWATDEDGMLVASPTTAWNTASAMNGTVGLLRIEYSIHERADQQTTIQLALTSTQVRQLSLDLAKLADLLEDELGNDLPKRAGPTVGQRDSASDEGMRPDQLNAENDE